MQKFFRLVAAFFVLLVCTSANPFSIEIAVLKYKGGGDWYANPSSLTNLALFCNQNIATSINPEYATVEPASLDLFNYPYIHMTGHGNVLFDDEEAKNLRTYLLGGGFLHIDDNYGMDPFIRAELKAIFPDFELQTVPPSHPIFHQAYDFAEGLPKIHQHDQKPPKAEGIFNQGRMMVLYTSECDLGDGWEDAEVHNDPAELRLKALQMGANIMQYALTYTP
jgi:hypothetical protein